MHTLTEIADQFQDVKGLCENIRSMCNIAAEEAETPDARMLFIELASEADTVINRIETADCMDTLFDLVEPDPSVYPYPKGNVFNLCGSIAMTALPKGHHD